MLSPKRLSLLLAATVFVSIVVVILTTTRGEGKTATPNGERVRVLRRKDQHNLPPTAAEIAWFKNQQLKQERELEDQIPKHLPVKVKIKAEKEKQFKDLDNPHWARDLELEVKNTGTKPIYRLGLLLLLPETQIAGGRLVFPLHYGRTELSVFNDKLELAKPEDIPIAPGETYIFKISESQVTGWEDSVRTEGWPLPKKVLIKFEELNFGDGTGFRWGDGVPWLPPGKTVLGACRQGLGAGNRIAEVFHGRWPNWSSGQGVGKFSRVGMPASYLPANFFSAGNSSFSFLNRQSPIPNLTIPVVRRVALGFTTILILRRVMALTVSPSIEPILYSAVTIEGIVLRLLYEASLVPLPKTDTTIHINVLMPM